MGEDTSCAWLFMLLVERPTAGSQLDVIRVAPRFRLFATMNPGSDFENESCRLHEKSFDRSGWNHSTQVSRG